MHDSHIHMGMSPLFENFERDISEFLSLGGKKILTLGSDHKDYSETLEVYEKAATIYPNVVDMALGIHPIAFHEAMLRNELDGLDLFKYANKRLTEYKNIFTKNKKYLTAIGETGLDYFDMEKDSSLSRDIKEDLKEIQKNSFRVQCQLALKNNLPLSIHARELPESTECIDDVLKIVAQEGNGTLRGSFHSYTGSVEKVEEILSLGFHIGFNAIITYPNGENVREILRATPVDRILFETDGPYLPVQSERKNKKAQKRYGRPASVREIMEIAAQVKGISIEQLEKISDESYFRVFS